MLSIVMEPRPDLLVAFNVFVLKRVFVVNENRVNEMKNIQVYKDLARFASASP